MSIDQFKATIEQGYQPEGKFFEMGAAMFNGEPVTGLHVKIPLKTMNRHGLIAGATGTGKTKTLQVISEQLSNAGVPVLLMDIKGDLSGLAKAAEPNEKLNERHDKIGLPYEAKGFPVELLTLSEEKGAKLRATVTEFGPVLFSKILDLSDAQQGVVAIIFKYCDDNKLPLIDLKDFKKMLNFITNEGADEIEELYGKVSTASTGSILRKIIELESQGAERFFGELSFDPEDLLHINDEGQAQISVLRLVDIQDKPKLFSTFMLSLLAEIYATFPEEGDAEKPKLAIFIDEAHLIFDKASDALLDQIEAIVKLIRSKGVGLFFVTQNPMDVPDSILGQLGLKVQHALRAFTAKDRKAIKLTAENYPISDFYETDEVLTSLGIGEALVTALSEKGIPTPLAVTYMRAPQSRMDILSKGEIIDLVENSKIVEKYNEEIDRESAFEMLSAKIESAQSEEHQKELKAQVEKGTEETKESREKRKPVEAEEGSFVEELSKNTMVRQLGRTMLREVSRGLLGALGVRRPRRRRGLF